MPEIVALNSKPRNTNILASASPVIATNAKVRCVAGLGAYDKQVCVSGIYCPLCDDGYETVTHDNYNAPHILNKLLANAFPQLTHSTHTQPGGGSVGFSKLLYNPNFIPQLLKSAARAFISHPAPSPLLMSLGFTLPTPSPTLSPSSPSLIDLLTMWHLQSSTYQSDPKTPIPAIGGNVFSHSMIQLVGSTKNPQDNPNAIHEGSALLDASRKPQEVHVLMEGPYDQVERYDHFLYKNIISGRIDSYKSASNVRRREFNDGTEGNVKQPNTPTNPNTSTISSPSPPTPSLPRLPPPGLPLAARRDMLCFESAPLVNGIEITGNVMVSLYVMSNRYDCDFYARLEDVYPPSKDYISGFALNIAHGIVSSTARYGHDEVDVLRKSGVHVDNMMSSMNTNTHDGDVNGINVTLDNTTIPLPSSTISPTAAEFDFNPQQPNNRVLLCPLYIHLVTIQLFPTSNLFSPGHRLRLTVGSSNYPHFMINPQTPQGQLGQQMLVADNTVLHSDEYPSSLWLPVAGCAACKDDVDMYVTLCGQDCQDQQVNEILQARL